MKIVHICKYWFPKTTGVTVHVDKLAQYMSEKGEEVYVYFLQGKQINKKFSNNKINISSLKKELENLRPDVIHVHSIWEHVYPSWQAAQSIGSRFFITIHGTWQFLYKTPGMKTFKNKLKFWWYYHSKWKKMVRSATAIIALNSIEERIYKKLKAPQIYRIPNGVDCQQFRPDRALESLSLKSISKDFLLFVGAIQEPKGIFTLLEALNILKEQNMNLPLVVAGSGPELEKAQQISRESSLNVSFLGKVPHENIPILMAKANLFILPSFEESFATVYLEAMASGTPCVGTNTGGTPEIIDHEENGYLIEPGNAQMLAHLLKKIFGSSDYKQRLKEMGQKARQKVEKNFDWRVIVPKLLDAYRT